MREKSCSTLRGFFKGVIIGSVIGVGAAIFVSSKPGEEIRKTMQKKGKQLKKDAEKAVGKALEVWEENKEDWQEKVSNLSSALEEKADHLADFFDDEQERMKETILTTQRAVREVKKEIEKKPKKEAITKKAVATQRSVTKDAKDDDIELARKVLSRASGRSFYKKK